MNYLKISLGNSPPFPTIHHVNLIIHHYSLPSNTLLPIFYNQKTSKNRGFLVNGG